MRICMPVTLSVELGQRVHDLLEDGLEPLVIASSHLLEEGV